MRMGHVQRTVWKCWWSSHGDNDESRAFPGVPSSAPPLLDFPTPFFGRH